MENKKYAVLSLSGGMDSSTLLLHLLSKGYDVTALSFDYGQKHKIELERATELVKYINSHFDERTKLHPDHIQDLEAIGANVEKEKKEWRELAPFIKHQIIKLDSLSQLLNSSLVEGGSEVPEGHYENENMKDTVVPNRNKIFSSIIQAVALSIATKNSEKQFVHIALGIHAGDHSIYPDCRKEFRDADMEAFRIGNWDSELVGFYTPYLYVNKFDILEDGLECCKELGLDFNEVYKRTNTSYKPIKITYPSQKSNIPGEEIESGKTYKWFSDYKSASSVERIEAFIKLGRPDPVAYADENGPVTWEVAKQHVEQILNKK